MPKAPAYSPPKRSGESIILSTGICVGAGLGDFLLFPSFMRHFNLYLHGTVITAKTSGAPHMVDRTFGAQKEVDYAYTVKGLTYHGSAAIATVGDDSGDLNVYYDVTNPSYSAVNYQEAILVMALFGALIFMTCASGIGAIMIARRGN
jgi:hypothetical protein